MEKKPPPKSKTSTPSRTTSTTIGRKRQYNDEDVNNMDSIIISNDDNNNNKDKFGIIDLTNDILVSGKNIASKPFNVEVGIDEEDEDDEDDDDDDDENNHKKSKAYKTDPNPEEQQNDVQCVVTNSCKCCDDDHNKLKYTEQRKWDELMYSKLCVNQLTSLNTELKKKISNYGNKITSLKSEKKLAVFEFSNALQGCERLEFFTEDSQTHHLYHPCTLLSNDDQCTICHDIMTTSDHDIVNTICGHQFHGFCLFKLLEKDSTNKCPNCRGVLLQKARLSPSGTMIINIISTTNDTKIYFTKSKKDEIQIVFHLPPAFCETCPNELSHSGLCISLHLPYNENNCKSLVKRLKYAFEHGLLFFLNRDIKSSDNKQCIIRPSLIMLHILRECESNKRTVRSQYDDYDGTKLKLTIYNVFNDTLINECHNKLDEMNIPKINSWWIPRKKISII
jgi:DNA-directed RNA polymerase subunit RPC12/RpoP